MIQSPKNLGFAEGNNLAIEHAKGELLLLINNDTWVEKNFLEQLVEELHSRNLDVIGPREADYITKAKRKKYSSHIDPLGHPVYLYDSEKPNFYLTGVCLLFKKSLYKEIGGFDSNFFMYCEEIDWFWRLQMSNKKFAYSDEALVYHAGSGSTGREINYPTFLWRNQNTLQMLLKNYKHYNLVWVIPLYLSQNLLEMTAFLMIAKPKITISYLQGIWFNVKHLPATLAKRKQIQKNRLVKNKEIFSKMYLGPGKALHLIQNLATKTE